MLKIVNSMKEKEIEGKAAGALQALLAQVPGVTVQDIQVEPAGSERGIDILAHIEVSARKHLLVCEVKSSGQPRYVRSALLQLRNCAARLGNDATPIFIAPYLSPDAQALCRENDVGYLDLAGNARVIFDKVFIERLVATKPSVERRELKSLFKPKSAQVLRLMLRDPRRSWRVAELAKAAGVSLGHVSNVRSGLLDREWARVGDGGLHASAPDALLDAWRDAYEPPAGKRIGFYTVMHGSSFEKAARYALGKEFRDQPRAAFASFSAAQWLAPYGRIGTHYFYADDIGLDRLRSTLDLSPMSKGENIVITVLNDVGLLRDTVEPASGAICTSPVQTYLDLTSSGERGREAADHLRCELLKWPT